MKMSVALVAGLLQQRQQLSDRAVGLRRREQYVRVEKDPHPRCLAGGFPGTARTIQDLGELGLGLVEFPNPFLAVDFDRQCHGGSQQQSLRSRLRDQLIISLESKGAAKLGRERDDASARQGERGFHACRLAELLFYCNQAHDPHHCEWTVPLS